MALWTTNDLVKKSDRALLERLVMCSTVGIWRKNDEGPHGTGVLAAVDERVFIVTAGHVLDDLTQDGQINFPSGSAAWNLNDIVKLWPPVFVGKDARHMGEPDIGFIELAREKLPRDLPLAIRIA